MENRKVFKKSLLLLAVMTIMLFAMSISSMAATTVTNIAQTDDGSSSVKVSFTGVDGYSYYNVYYSSSEAGTYVRKTSNSFDTTGTYFYLTALSEGTSYYVYVVPVSYASGTYTEHTELKSSTIEVVTTPDKVTNLVQTSATNNSVSLSWTAATGATGYTVKDSDTGATTNVSTNSATVAASAGTSDYYYVYSEKKSSAGYVASSVSYAYVKAYATPGKVANVASASDGNLTWHPTESNKVTVGWDKNSNDSYTASGYQVQIFSVDGKSKLKTCNITKQYTTYTTFNIKKVKNKGFKVRVRGYVTVNGTNYYGAWSSKKTVIPQASISLTQKSKTSVTVSWNKVSNATGYTIYYCKNINASNPKWVKAKTVGKNVTSYTVKKLTNGKTAGFYVIPTVKVKGKKYKASATWYLYTRLSKYY